MWGISTGIRLKFTDHLTACCRLLDHVSSFKFQETFFPPPENKMPMSRLLFPPIGYNQHLLRSDWPDGGHVCIRQNQTTPPSLNSFMCNWYLARRNKTPGISLFWGNEMKFTPESAVKVSLLNDSRAARRLGLCFFWLSLNFVKSRPNISQGVHCQSCYLFIQ